MVVVLGSGGHTAEMMSLLRDIDVERYTHRSYIISSGDSFSASKAQEIERLLQSKLTGSTRDPSAMGQTETATGTWNIETVPRAREIHQPLYTTPFSSLRCFLGCLGVLRVAAKTSKAAPGQYPDVIIANGPATAVMVILAAAVLKYFGIAPVLKMKIIYVESWARVKTLSLSGKLLLKMRICDRFLVQWEALAKNINGNGTRKEVEWVGFLVE